MGIQPKGRLVEDRQVGVRNAMFDLEQTTRGVDPGGPAWRPEVDVFERPDGFLLCFSVPGVRQEDIQVVATDETVTVHGVRDLAAATDATHAAWNCPVAISRGASGCLARSRVTGFAPNSRKACCLSTSRRHAGTCESASNTRGRSGLECLSRSWGGYQVIGNPFPSERRYERMSLVPFGWDPWSDLNHRSNYRHGQLRRYGLVRPGRRRGSGRRGPSHRTLDRG
jgi:hypothetical protein